MTECFFCDCVKDVFCFHLAYWYIFFTEAHPLRVLLFLPGTVREMTAFCLLSQEQLVVKNKGAAATYMK